MDPVSVRRTSAKSCSWPEPTFSKRSDRAGSCTCPGQASNLVPKKLHRWRSQNELQFGVQSLSTSFSFTATEQPTWESPAILKSLSLRTEPRLWRLRCCNSAAICSRTAAGSGSLVTVTALVRIVLGCVVSKREAWRETWRQKSTAVNPRHILLSNHSGVSFAERTTTIAVNPRHIFLSNHSEFSQTNRAGCPSVT